MARGEEGRLRCGFAVSRTAAEELLTRRGSIPYPFLSPTALIAIPSFTRIRSYTLARPEIRNRCSLPGRQSFSFVYNTGCQPGQFPSNVSGGNPYHSQTHLQHHHDICYTTIDVLQLVNACIMVACFGHRDRHRMGVPSSEPWVKRPHNRRFIPRKACATGLPG